MISRDLLGFVRLPLRALGVVGYTAALYAEYDLVCRARGETYDRLHHYTGRFAKRVLAIWSVALQARGYGVEPERRVPRLGSGGRGRVFVSNHRSALDIPVLLAVVEGRIVSRADLARWPLVGKTARRAGTLFVERENRRSGARVLLEMVAELERGEAIIIFPEGTTFEGDEVRPFRLGAFNASRRSGAEIVPVGLAYEGAAATFGDESFLEHLARVGRAPGTRCAVVVGEPIPVGDLEATDLERLVHARVQALVHEARGVLNEPR